MATRARASHHWKSDRYKSFVTEFANWEEPRHFFVTFDVDWAPDYMIEPVLHLLDRYGVSATFFATHDSVLLKQIARSGRHEVGFHPNLQANSSQGQGIAEILAFLSKIYPDARGNRFHVLGRSYRDLMMLNSVGIRYDVSTFLYNIPFLLPAGHRDLQLMLAPYFWEDGVTENMGGVLGLKSMNIDSPGLKIFNFHPMNVYINGQNAEPRLDFLNSVGPLLECPESVAQRFRLADSTGAGVALEELLHHMQSNNIASSKMQDLCEAFFDATGDGVLCV